MKDEIKEILDDLRNKDCYINNETTLTFDEAKDILDCITNLQEENKNRISESLAYDLAAARVKELEYRIDKAKDKIQYIIDYGFDYDGFNTIESLKGLIDMLVDYAKQSKDILNGDDE